MDSLTTREQEALNASSEVRIEDANGTLIEDGQGNQTDTTAAAAQQQEADVQMTIEKPTVDSEANTEGDTEANTEANTETEAKDEQQPTDDDLRAELERLKQEVAEQKAAVEEAAIIEAAGGAEAYQSMVTWASTALPADQIDMYDAVMQEGTAAQKMFAMNALRAMYQLDMNVQGQTLSGSGASAVSGYESDAEFYADLSNPLYSEQTPAGEAFRRKVESRMRTMSTARNNSGWISA